MRLNQIWVDDFESNKIVDLDYFKSRNIKMFNNLKIIICDNELYLLTMPFDHAKYLKISDKDCIKLLLTEHKNNKELVLELITILLQI